MSLIKGEQKASRAIKRIKIKQRMATNPEEPRTAEKLTINRATPAKSYEFEQEQKTSPSVVFAQTKYPQFITQKFNTSFHNSCTKSEKNQIDGKDKNKNASERPVKHQQNIYLHVKQGKGQKQIPNSKQKQEKQHRNQPFDPRRVIHMNFKEYEELIKKSDICPSYFENIAKKNDQNMVKRDQNLQKDYFSNKSIDKNKIIHNYKSQKEQRLPAVIKTKRAITVRTNTEGNNSMKTILGCNLGALSNLQIKEKLEEKWINEQRQIIKNKALVFTEESQIVSEIETRQQTNREEFLFRDDKNKNKTTPKEKEPIDWNMIPNEKFKQALRRILELKQNGSIVKNPQKQYSFGEEYSQKQQNMLATFNLYRPKQFIMKHKLQWKL